MLYQIVADLNCLYSILNISDKLYFDRLLCKLQTVVPVFATLIYNQKSTLKAQNGIESSNFLYLLCKLRDIVT